MSGGSFDSDSARRARRLRRFDDRAYNRGRRRTDPALAAAAAVYVSTRWRKLRDAYIREHPLCEACARDGHTAAARDVDHIVPLSIAPERAFDESNLQALCRSCHNAKTQAERQAAARGEVSSSAPRDPEAPPASATAHLVDGTRVTVLFPAAAPPSLVARVRQSLQRWADGPAAEALGFSPVVVVKQEDAGAGPTIPA